MKATRTFLVAAALAAMIAVSACAAGSGDTKGASTRGVSASGVVDGLDFALSLTTSTPQAGTPARARVDAVNSTEATVTTGVLFRVEITDSRGNSVPTDDPQRYIIAPVDISPRSTFRHDAYFTVPPPGRYALTLSGAKRKDGGGFSLAFTSVR